MSKKLSVETLAMAATALSSYKLPNTPESGSDEAKRIHKQKSSKPHGSRVIKNKEKAKKIKHAKMNK